MQKEVISVITGSAFGNVIEVIPILPLNAAVAKVKAFILAGNTTTDNEVFADALKFTAMLHEGTTATLSIALNTNMIQYQKLTVTPGAIGLIILIGQLL